jgi:hypothetical protein
MQSLLLAAGCCSQVANSQLWTVIPPESLRTPELRIRIQVPERAGDFATRGSTPVFETSVDDYAEIWIDGELPYAAGQSGSSVVAGWNAANRLILTRSVQPGQRIQLVVFGANGPLSAAPTNFIYLCKAQLEFYPGDPESYAVPPH